MDRHETPPTAARQRDRGGMLGLKAVTKGKGELRGSLPVDMESFNDLGFKSFLFWLASILATAVRLQQV